MNLRTHTRLAASRLLGGCPSSLRAQKIDKKLQEARSATGLLISAYGYLKFMLMRRGTACLLKNVLTSPTNIKQFCQQIRAKKQVFPQLLLSVARQAKSLLQNVNDMRAALPYLQNMCDSAQLYILVATEDLQAAAPYRDAARQLINSYPQVIQGLPQAFAVVCSQLLVEDSGNGESDDGSEC